MNGFGRRDLLTGALAAAATGGFARRGEANPDGPFDGSILGGVAFEVERSPGVDTVPGMVPQVPGPVSMLLCLCMDMSHSVRKGEQDRVDETRLQIEGTADALSSPGVIDAVTRAENGIGLVCTQFSDSARQSVGFALLRSEADVLAYAALIREGKVMVPAGGTSITRGLAVSGAIIVQVRRDLPYVFRRAVIDISGDGRQGPDEWYLNLRGTVRELAVDHGIVVNGLAIQSPGEATDMLGYYRREVDTPPGFEYSAEGAAWPVPLLPGRSWSANSPKDFVQSLERKLVYEISGRILTPRSA